jgi:hypothetical protein
LISEAVGDASWHAIATASLELLTQMMSPSRRLIFNYVGKCCAPQKGAEAVLESAAEAKGCNSADVHFGKVKIEITCIAR